MGELTITEICQIEADKPIQMMAGIPGKFERNRVQMHDRVSFAIKLEFPVNGGGPIKNQNIKIYKSAKSTLSSFRSVYV